MESLEVQKYLTGDCGLHPQVLVDSAIGVIPPDINFSGAPLPNTLYVAALANKLSERPAQSALPPSAGLFIDSTLVHNSRAKSAFRGVVR
jgi:hypothetical protein